MKGPFSFRCLLLVALATGVRAEEKPAGGPNKSGNWLVDAMTGTPADSPDDSKSGEAPGGGRPMARDQPAGTKPADGVVNPLSSYLKTWITSRDYELLKAKGSDGNPRGLTAGAGRDDALAPAGLTPGMPPNPYLPDAAPGVAAKPIPRPNPPAATPPGSVSLAAKDNAAPAKTAGPPAEVRKAQDDSKYFPQLKRF